MLTGTLYHCDGTRAAKPFKIKFDFNYTHELKTECGWDGTFLITEEEWPVEVNVFGDDPKWPSNFKLYVNGELIKHSRINRKGNHLVIILTDLFGRPKNDGGGLITGQVLDGESPYGEAKVSAEASQRSFMSLLTSNLIETKCDKKGRFALEIPKGLEVTKLTVDGNTPKEGYRLNKEGEKIPVNLDRVKAGTFGLKLERQGRFLFW